jgi:hypothetical protein
MEMGMGMAMDMGRGMGMGIGILLIIYSPLGSLYVVAIYDMAWHGIIRICVDECVSEGVCNRGSEGKRV